MANLNKIKFLSLFILTLTVILVMGSCSSVPLTGRRQMSFLPEGMLVNMALTNYQEFITANPTLPASDQRVQAVRRVGNRISKAVNQYLTESGEGDRVSNFQWEFNVVHDESVNAWAMPGGKIMFYTGIFPVTQNDEGIAVVMAHEIAHAVAKHGNERMSQQLLLTLGAVSLDAAMSQRPEATRDIFLMTYGVGSQLGTLAYSRKHEYEADKLGMIFMAMAGYNPAGTVTFWERMQTSATGAEPPQFLSTHPSSSARIKAARDFIPEAMSYYSSQ
ncbi:MAG: M48 family metallopeptidase [Bacteroidales bacterium]|jgi:predicted Zn-dependent protease|nr:M48 family metallopeptidase [Bacteroidales bacterium]